MKVFRFQEETLSSESKTILEKSQPLYFASGHSAVFRLMQAAGLDCRQLDGEVSEEGTFVIDESEGSIKKLVEIAGALLAPGGCPWDRAQTHQSLKKYLLEESYELFDAIDDEDWPHVQEELGDVLLQPIMHALMAERDGRFGLHDVCQSISEKLIRRHPHVFGSTQVANVEEVLANWDKIKIAERAGGEAPKQGLLGDIPKSMPGLAKSSQLGVRASRVGFDWADLKGVKDKVAEEILELDEAIASQDESAIAEELGDLLFAIAQMARKLGIDPEEAVQSSNKKFVQRFNAMERIEPSGSVNRSAEE